MSQTEVMVPNFAAIKTRQQAAWSTGDYAAVGVALVLMAEQLCEALDVRSGWQVLDVAAGSGNSSLAAARRGCWVVSTDYVPSLLERGKERAAAEGLRMEFEVADAEKLPFADASFDCALSTVGVMFAPDQEKAAAELARVVRQGGKIGLACWTPTGFVGQIFRCIGKRIAPMPGVRSPMEWGTEGRLAELFPGAKIEARRREFMFRALSPEGWLEHFKTYYGPMNKTYAALDGDAQAGLTSDLLALVASLNRSGDATMVLPSEYLEVVITR